MRFMILIVMPVVTIFLILIKIPDFEKWLKELNEYAPLYATCFLVAATLLNYYLTIFSPYKAYVEMKKNRWAILEKTALTIIKYYKDTYNYDVSFNIMIPKTSFMFKSELSRKYPGKIKRSFYGRIFKVIWERGTEGVHHTLNITENQGLCGQVYLKGTTTSPTQVRAAVFLPPYVSQYNFNLNPNQAELTKELVIVACCPLVIKKKTEDFEEKKTIGVLNVESSSSGSEALIVTPDLRKIFYDHIANFAELYKTLHF